MVEWISADVLFQNYRQRLLQKDRNLLVFVGGQTGSGKSMAGLKFCEALDPGFHAGRVCFTPREFMEVLRRDKTLSRGSAILFDEIGIAMNSRNWYSLANKMLNYVLQSFRYKNLAVVFSAPAFTMLDSQARLLFHTYIECDGKINRDLGLNYAKIFNVSYSPRDGKMYFKYPILPQAPNYRFEYFAVGLPSPELVAAYKTKKNAFTANLEKDVDESLNEIENKVLTAGDLMNLVVEDGLDKVTLKTRTGTRFDASLISAEYGVPAGLAKQVKQLLERDYSSILKVGK